MMTVVARCRSLPFSLMCLSSGDYLQVFYATVFERAGRLDEALQWAGRLATEDDVTKGGNLQVPVRVEGLQIKGRCLAAQGKYAEAEAALVSAAEQLAAIGWWLGEVLVWRDFLVCVLRKTDREDAEGMSRLKASIGHLLGAAPAHEDLDVLATALGDDIDLAAFMS